MKINEYSKFLSNRKVYEMILETKIEYMNDFKKILSKIDHPISKDLLDLIGKDIDINTTQIGLGDSTDDVSFHTTDEKEEIYIIVDQDSEYTTFPKLFTLAGLDPTEMQSGRLFLPNGTEGEIVNRWDRNNSNGITYQTIYQFKSKDGKYCFIQPHGVELKLKPKGKSQRIKIGRLALKMLNKVDKKYSAKDIEAFVNKFKAQVEISKDKSSFFELVNGDDIKYWYSVRRYVAGNGSLQNSCMRYDECSGFFKIYTENKEKVSLLIYKDEYDDDKISARSIVWKLDDGKTFMDRIYYTREEQVEMFKNYAIEKGWIFKVSQNSISSEKVSDGSKHFNLYLTVTLDEVIFNKYPYVDTLTYLYKDTNQLSSNSFLDKTYYDIELDFTEGSNECETCEGERLIECPNCDGSGESNCSECYGRGESRCETCDGDGSVDCDKCSGYGEYLDTDENMIDCSKCNRRGKITCDDCNNGNVECGFCDGRGEVTCSRCDGETRIDCPDCV